MSISETNIPTEFLTHSFSITHGWQAKLCVFYIMPLSVNQEQWEWKWKEELQQQQHPSFFFQGVGSAQLDWLSSKISKVL